MVTNSQNSNDPYLRSRAAQLARHEMGHYVLARYLGFDSGDVGLSIYSDRQSHDAGAATRLAASIGDLDALRRYLERRVITLYAGSCAEALETGRVDDKKASGLIQNPPLGAEKDYAIAAQLIHLLRNVVYPKTDPRDDVKTQDELKEINDELWTQAIQHVEQFAKTIESLGGRLAERVKRFNRKFTISKGELEELPEVLQIPKADFSKDFLV